MGRGTDDYILVKFQFSVSGVNMWGKEVLGGGLASPSAFLVHFLFVFLFLWRASVKNHYFCF